MGLFNHFPYPDTHQLNLDWILDAVKGCVDKVTELWTYVKEPGAGIQKALTDAQAAATTSKTFAQSAQKAANDSQSAANDAGQFADNSAESVELCEQYLANVQAMMGKLYPVGAVYVNYRNQAMSVESDATVIARLKALTGGTWARAGSHGQPVTASGQMGWATVNLGNAAGDAVDTNFNIYVRTA